MFYWAEGRGGGEGKGKGDIERPRQRETEAERISNVFKNFTLNIVKFNLASGSHFSKSYRIL
jgi:hypothetical protein